MSRLVVYGVAWGAVCLLLVAGGCERITPPSPMADSDAANYIHLSLTSGADQRTTDEGGPSAPVGTGWATLKGRFVFKGTPPQRRRLLISKDAAICAPGGSAPMGESLVVDASSGGIANIAIFLRGTSRVHESAQPNDEKVLFDQKQCIFLSHVISIRIGQTLEIKNSDPVGHNTKIDVRQGASFNQTIPSNQSLGFKPTDEENTPAPVSCSIHPWMSAYLLPRSNGYVAVTAADGSFEIANLPAGEELEFQVWHEHSAKSGGALVIETPEASQLQWSNRGRFKVKLEQDQSFEIHLEVPEGAFKG